jgi:hypothetical protein
MLNGRQTEDSVVPLTKCEGKKEILLHVTDFKMLWASLHHREEQNKLRKCCILLR